MGGFIRLPKVGLLRFRTKQIIRGEIISVTIKMSASGKYYGLYSL